jgi:hypothetical protein
MVVYWKEQAIDVSVMDGDESHSENQRLNAMIEIRCMVGEEHSHKQIMNALGLPQRSFYRYHSQAYEHDSKLLQQQNREMLALVLSVLKERLTNAYRRLAAMAD